MGVFAVEQNDLRDSQLEDARNLKNEGPQIGSNHCREVNHCIYKL